MLQRHLLITFSLLIMICSISQAQGLFGGGGQYQVISRIKGGSIILPYANLDYDVKVQIDRVVLARNCPTFIVRSWPSSMGPVERKEGVLTEAEIVTGASSRGITLYFKEPVTINGKMINNICIVGHPTMEAKFHSAFERFKKLSKSIPMEISIPLASGTIVDIPGSDNYSEYIRFWTRTWKEVTFLNGEKLSDKHVPSGPLNIMVLGGSRPQPAMNLLLQARWNNQINIVGGYLWIDQKIPNIMGFLDRPDEEVASILRRAIFQQAVEKRISILDWVEAWSVLQN